MRFFGNFTLLLLSLSAFLWATPLLETSLLRSFVYEGESATLLIHAKGEKVVLPKIKTINGNEVVDKGGTIQTQEEQGVTRKEYVYYLTFFPKESTPLETFEVTIDGKTYHTAPLPLTLLAHPKKSYTFSYQLPQRDIVQNELFKVTMQFRYETTLNLSDIKIEHPSFEGLWVQHIEYKPVYHTDSDQIVYEIDYYMYATKAGNVSIGEAKISATQQLKDEPSLTSLSQHSFIKTYKRMFRVEPVTLAIKAQQKSPYVGSFALSATTDKKRLDGNETLIATVKIKGYGNLDDIKPYTLSLSNATVLAQEPYVKTSRSLDGSKEWEWTQHFKIGHAKGDILIPRFSLHYYDPSTISMKETWSDEMLIVVENPVVDESIIGGGERVKSLSWYERLSFEEETMSYITFIIGFILGVGTLKLRHVVGRRWRCYRSFIPLSHEALLRYFLPYKQTNEEISHCILMLEKALYIEKSSGVTWKEHYRLYRAYSMIKALNDKEKRV